VSTWGRTCRRLGLKWGLWSSSTNRLVEMCLQDRLACWVR
jgi:hypothetical protein